MSFKKHLTLKLLQLTSLTLNDYQHDGNNQLKSHGERCLSFYIWKEQTGVGYLCAYFLSYICLAGEIFIINSLQVIQAHLGKYEQFLFPDNLKTSVHDFTLYSF